MKGIFLCACKERHPTYNITYNDYDKKYNCDITCNCLEINLKNYDYILASPPCNFYSIARGAKWHVSEYALQTMHLLPILLKRLSQLNKPFIIENVKNDKLFTAMGIYDLAIHNNIYIYKIGRHTYFTNIKCDLNCDQQQDFKYGGKRINNDGYNQGGKNVYNVMEKWLEHIHYIYREKQY